MKHDWNLRYLLMGLLTSLFLFTGCEMKTEQADLVLKNGTFFTVNKELPKVQAVAIQGERILDVGSNEEIEFYITPQTQVIDLKGAFGCPGFNDAHLHLLGGGLNALYVDLRGVQSAREMRTKVIRAIRNLPPGAWLVGWGWDETLFEDKQIPTKRYFDVVAPDVPIFLKRVCLHAALVNSKALEIAGLNAETPNPPGGKIEKDPRTRELTGILKEEAIKLVTQYIPEPTEEMKKEAILTVLSELKKVGVTSIQDNSSVEMLDLYESIQKEGLLTCRISEWSALKMDLKPYKRYRRKYRDNHLCFGLLKGFVDGSLGARSAALFEPYSDDPEERGIPIHTQDELNQLFVNADREGFQLGIHAVGDAANRMVLDAFELTRKVNGARDSRHRVEHAQILAQEDFSRFKDLNVVVSMQPFGCIDDLRWAEDRLGVRRCQNAYAWKSVKESGAVLAFGTDWPVSPLNPMISLYAAVTRQDTTGFPQGGWYPREKLTMAEAIEAYTLGSAYAEFMDQEKGSIEPGKLADIVILDRNLLEVDPSQVLKIQVKYTILGGKIIYQKDEK